MNYLLDLHVHTSASLDGLSSLNGQAAAAKTAGLDAIAVTDHNLCTPLPQSLEARRRREQAMIIPSPII